MDRDPIMEIIPEKTASCPICHQGQLMPLLQIENSPILNNVLWASLEEAQNSPKGKIHLAFCMNCGHIFNRSFEPEKIKYTQSYENSLHFSPHFQEYAHSLAADLVERYQLYNKDVIEIGAGQGDFLALLSQLGGNRGVGFDPSYTGPESGEPSGRLAFYREYYSENYKHLPVDFLLSRHVFEHIEAPDDFLAMIRRVISDRKNVTVFFEVPDVSYTLFQGGIWDILYEHYSYFSPASLAYVFKQNGFKVCLIASTFGGQFLTIEAVPGESLDSGGEFAVTGSHLKMAAAAFSSTYQKKVDYWQQQVKELKSAGKRAVVWGAGTKGISFLNTLDCREIIDYVIDINPRKKGRYISGAGQQIMPPEFLLSYQPDYVIVMNGNYEEEIQTMLQNLGVKASVLLA